MKKLGTLLVLLSAIGFATLSGCSGNSGAGGNDDPNVKPSGGKSNPAKGE